MKRAQIILEEWQHEKLKVRAAREGTSISAVVREILTEKLRSASKQDLAEICGIASGPDLTNEEIDEILYGDP